MVVTSDWSLCTNNTNIVLRGEPQSFDGLVINVVMLKPRTTVWESSIHASRIRIVFLAPPSLGRILGRNPDRSLKSFPPCYSQLPLYLFLQTHATSYRFCKGKRRKT
jgi:hypothetical protein